MDGSPSSVLTMGLGTWSEVGLVVTLGLGVGAVTITATSFLEYTAPQRSLDFTAPQRTIDYAAPSPR